MKDIKKQLLRTGHAPILIFVGIFVVVGTLSLLVTHAATVLHVFSVSPESGTLSGNVALVPDATAIGGKALKFGMTKATVPSGGSTTTGDGQNMIVGVNINGIGSNAGPDMAGAVKYVRADMKSWGLSASTFTNSGIKIDDLLQGPYSTSGISGLGSPTTWANTALGWYQSAGCNPTLCPMVEVLNEPGGTWFWGGSSLTVANATAYDNILIATYNAFTKAYGSSRPLVLASFDGGYSTGSDWGQYMWQANSAIGNYINGITVHPYDTSSSGLGSQTNVTNSYTQAKSLAGRSIPVYITEIGWQTTPTASETTNGDTPQPGTVLLSTSQQCSNVYNFIGWARGLKYVNAVILFDYRDDNANTAGDGTYGIEYADGTHKPSYAGIAAAALDKANPC